MKILKPNIVLIMVDQMRRDCMRVMGHDIVETPNLDMMKKKGVMFSKAYSAVPSCIAARAALMTGLTQDSHGRVGYMDCVNWDYEHTLAGEFSDAGYHTQCVGKMHVYPTRNLCGFHNVILHDGFMHHSRDRNRPMKENWMQTDDYIQWLHNNIGNEADVNMTGLEANSWVARPWPYEENLHPSNWVVTESIDFLRRKDPTKPFFLMASFVRPHAPLDPPQVYYDMYINEEIPKPPIGDWAKKDDELQEGLLTNCGSGIISDKALRRARAAYYGCITQIDHQIGRLLQALEEYNSLKNSIVIFTADHGELLGDHNLFRKALPYEGSAGVPLLVYDPGNLLGCEYNRIIDNPVELRDILPTLLDMADINIPESIEGESIVPLLNKEDIEWREYIHGEHSYGVLSNHYITNGNQKYIWFSQTGIEQYFDLENDPNELHNLIDDNRYQENIDYYRNELIKELANREEGYSDGKTLIIGKKPKACLDKLIHK